MKVMSSSLVRVVAIGNERFYPASADEVFYALETSVAQLFKTSSSDRNGRSVRFTTGMSAFSYGALLWAQVVPVEGGAHVRVAGSLTMSTNFTAKGRENKNTVRLLDAIGTDLATRPAPATGSVREPSRPVAAAGWFPDPGGMSRQRYWDGQQWTGHCWPEN
jgi:hypothetical protein